MSWRGAAPATVPAARELADWGTRAADRDTKEHQGKKGGRRDGR